MTEDCKVSYDAEEGELKAVMQTQLKEISTKVSYTITIHTTVYTPPYIHTTVYIHTLS
jgi:hypothetical protein